MGISQLPHLNPLSPYYAALFIWGCNLVCRDSRKASAADRHQANDGAPWNPRLTMSIQQLGHLLHIRLVVNQQHVEIFVTRHPREGEHVELLGQPRRALPAGIVKV